jgi:hypothetical protein
MPTAYSTNPLIPSPADVRYFYGDAGTPRDIRQMRLSTMETMRRMGTPVLLKRLYTVRDVDHGRARRSPAWDDDYKQVRAHDPLSHGVGFVSIDDSPAEWYDPSTFEILNTPDPTNPNGIPQPAPLYRGYGPGFLTYVILPDRAENVFKLDPRGVLTRTQDATVQLPWWPLVGDNDLLITVQINRHGKVIDSFERYQLKQVTPITMRGSEQGDGSREFDGANAGGNRFWVGQECEATKVPDEDPIYDVEIDR